MVAEFAEPTIREVYVGRYRVIYEVATETVEVLGVIHGARDLTAMWEEEQRRRRKKKWLFARIRG